MPYKNNSDLPKKVFNNLPEHALDIYREAFNHAWDEYSDPNKRRDANKSREEICHKVAWNAVKNKYYKDEDGKWKAK
jgi:cation transport regulator